jgi:hypothetical protein
MRASIAERHINNNIQRLACHAQPRSLNQRHNIYASSLTSINNRLIEINVHHAMRHDARLLQQRVIYGAEFHIFMHDSILFSVVGTADGRVLRRRCSSLAGSGSTQQQVVYGG